MTEKHAIIKNLKQELRKGTLVIAVLSQLTNKHYGYSLVESLNNKGLDIDQNTLYPLLRRLDKSGLLEASWEVEEPRPRKYYQLSPLGLDVVSELKQELIDNHSVMLELLKEVS